MAKIFLQKNGYKANITNFQWCLFLVWYSILSVIQSVNTFILDVLKLKK